MRWQGRYTVSPDNPRAQAVCDRCGGHYNHYQLTWQYQWVGTTLKNLYKLVCPTCLDQPQEQLRNIIIPPDPVPIKNARPENYPNADNPQSNAGVSADFWHPSYGNRIGSLTGGGGINSAFDGNPYKPAYLCASNSISNSSYGGYVGINWDGNYGVQNFAADLLPATNTHSLLSFTAYAPSDRSFLGTTTTSYVVQSSDVGGSVWSNWTTISSGTTAGTAGEIISADCTGDRAQFHRIAFLGDSLNFVSIAQVQFNVAQTGELVAP